MKSSIIVSVLSLAASAFAGFAVINNYDNGNCDHVVGSTPVPDDGGRCWVRLLCFSAAYSFQKPIKCILTNDISLNLQTPM